MAKKNKSGNSKVVPILVLAAILGGGYYVYTNYVSSEKRLTQSDDTVFDVLVKPIPSEDETDGLESEDSEFSVDLEMNDQILDGQDIGTVEHSDEGTTAESAHKDQSKRTSSKASTATKSKNAYVDEYGNVIYTQPNGVAPIKYKTARMGRWGYSVKYPSFLSKQTHSSDGSTFEDNKKRKLATYATWNVLNESISDLYNKDFPGIKSVSYKKMLRKQNAYVKSGYTKDNRIFYLKESIIEKDGQEVVVTLIYYYPKSDSNQATKVVNEVFGTFPIL